MLNYSSRQRFEQLRARWEKGAPTEEEKAEMVGRREKYFFAPPVNVESDPGGGSKFRRTLSHGLAFISNPLLQRKVTPGRHQVNIPTLFVTESTATVVTDATVAPCEHEASFSAHDSITPFVRFDRSPTKLSSPANDESPAKSIDPNATPRPLPRSQTLSFIPRPVIMDPTSADMQAAGNSGSLAPKAIPMPYALPSKIPTPSPPLSQHRGLSPHHYLPLETPQQVEHIMIEEALAPKSNASLVKGEVRSRTTPNLANVVHSQQPAGLGAPRKMGSKIAAGAPAVQKVHLQENVPTNRRVAQRRSHTQEHPLRRESLAVAGTISNRRLSGLATPLSQKKQPSFAIPPTARTRVSSHLTQQTPVTDKRWQPLEQVDSGVYDPPRVLEDSSPVQSCLLGPTDPSTPTPSTTNSINSSLLQFDKPNDLQRRTLGTPNGLAGVWRSSRALAESDHEVRKLPRSYTFHNFGTQWEAAPPLPPIPEQCRTPSLPHLTNHSHVAAETPVKYPVFSMLSTIPSCEQNSGNTTTSDLTDSITAALYPVKKDDASSTKPAAPYQLSLSILSHLSGVSPVSTANLGSYDYSIAIKYPWSFSDQVHSEIADVDTFLQVKDYMPPLYWAGRFQSRFDQWRTDAMVAELRPDYQRTGPMSECRLDQEKLASCYIFSQLRDLCTSHQAADSLGV